MPLFGRKHSAPTAPAAPSTGASRPIPEEINAQEFSLKLSYAAKTSEGVRIRARDGVLDELPAMVQGITTNDVELIYPLPVELGDAAPFIARADAGAQWIEYHAERSPITRHALVVLESVDAIDLAYETVALALLDGEIDTGGYPEYNAIVGGVAAHWDEGTGDLVVRGVVGWGGRGVRGDTDRAATKLLTRLFSSILADEHVEGMAGIELPMGTGEGGVVCAHCGFSSGHERAFYCPKCGMRLLRG